MCAVQRNLEGWDTAVIEKKCDKTQQAQEKREFRREIWWGNTKDYAYRKNKNENYLEEPGVNRRTNESLP